MNDMMNQLAMLLAGQQPKPQPATVTTGGIYPGFRPDTPVIVDPSGDRGGGRRKKKPLSPYEKRVDAAAVKGPSAYTPAMRKNIGMNKPTIGYGNPVEDNTSAFTKLVDLFAPPRAPEPTVQQPAQQPEQDQGGFHPPPMIPHRRPRRNG